MSKYGHRTINWFEAIVNKLGGEDAAERFLRDELVVSKPTRSWCEEDGVIYFSVTSDGTTGEDWINRLKIKGFRGRNCAEVLRSPDFKQPTNGVTTEVAVLKGMLFEENDRITKKIRAEASAGTFTKGRKLSKPNAELACLIREKFTDKEIEDMGLLWVVTMHEPTNDSLLGACRGLGGRAFCACQGSPDFKWPRDNGFAFAVSQVGSQS